MAEMVLKNSTWAGRGYIKDQGSFLESRLVISVFLISSLPILLSYSRLPELLGLSLASGSFHGISSAWNTL